MELNERVIEDYKDYEVFYNKVISSLVNEGFRENLVTEFFSKELEGKKENHDFVATKVKDRDYYKRRHKKEKENIKGALGILVVSVIGIMLFVKEFLAIADKKLVAGAIIVLFGMMCILSVVALIGYVGADLEYKKEYEKRKAELEKWGV